MEVTKVGKEDHPSIVTKTLGSEPAAKRRIVLKGSKGGRITKGDLVETV
ncbi:MAG: hypothetical protein GX052_10910 [Syntrophomonadaceae bacterium]|nr:hypothetical protein [Syntrophomonadaceae bacterium]